MSMITGYSTEVPAPPLVRRPRGLLIDAMLPIPVSEDRPTDPGSRDFDPTDKIWAGVNFCSLGCSGLDTWADRTCVEVGEDIEVPDSNPDGDGASFTSFLISAGETSPANYDAPWISSRLGSRLSAMHSAAMAYELLTGTQTENPSLQSSATHVVAAKTPPGEALFVLEDILADFDDLRFTVHMDPATFTLLNLESVFRRGDDGNNYVTPTGHLVVADAGHDGTLGPVDPDNPDGPAIVTAGDGRWIYASQTVYGLVGPERPLGTEEGRHDWTNDTRRDVRVMSALVAFDPCAVVAIQVDVPAYTVDTAGS